MGSGSRTSSSSGRHSSRRSSSRDNREKPRRGRSHSGGGGGSSSRSRSRSPRDDGQRVHVADLGIDCSKREVEKAFEKFGRIKEVWLARNPPCFAFIVYRHKEDAEEAIRKMDGEMLCGGRVRVTMARPRTRGRRRRGFDPNLRCYQCGRRGHFSRNCPDVRYGYRRPSRGGRQDYGQGGYSR